MTKYTIVSPNGVKVCIINVGYLFVDKEYTELYADESRFEKICNIPSTWAVIPTKSILSE